MGRKSDPVFARFFKLKAGKSKDDTGKVYEDIWNGAWGLHRFYGRPRPTRAHPLVLLLSTELPEGHHANAPAVKKWLCFSSQNMKTRFPAEWRDLFNELSESVVNGLAKKDRATYDSILSRCVPGPQRAQACSS